MTSEQVVKLMSLVKRGLLSDFVTEPDFWADWIIDRMDSDSLIEYLDLPNKPPHIRAEIIEEIGFDPVIELRYPMCAWQTQVAEGLTALGYDEWVKLQQKSEAPHE